MWLRIFRFAALSPRVPLQYSYVHALWQKNTKLTVLLPENWRPVIGKRVKGKKEIPGIHCFYWALLLADGALIVITPALIRDQAT